MRGGTVNNYHASIIKLVVGGFLFSSSAILVALADIGAGGASFYRMFFSLLVFATVVAVKRTSLIAPPKEILFFLLAGVFLATDLVLWHQSIYILGPGIGSILTNTQVFFMLVLGVLIFKEKLTIAAATSIVLAFIGIVFLTEAETNVSTLGLYGVLVGVTSGLAYAVSVVFLKLNADTKDKYRGMLYMSLGAIAVSLLYVAATGESLRIGDSNTLIYLLLYGILVQVVGWYLISESISRVTLLVAGLIFLIEPVFTLLFDIIFFGKTILPVQLFGALVVLCAMWTGVAFSREKT